MIDSKVRIVPAYVILTRVAWADDQWVRFDGSQERMHLGTHHFHIGDLVEIRITNARPTQVPRTEVEVGTGEVPSPAGG